MKRLVRSKSETDMFFDKENLEIINENLKKFRNFKMIKKNSNNNDQGNITLRGTKNLKKNAKSALMNLAKEEMQNSKKLETFKNDNPKKENDIILQNFKNFLKMILRFKLEFDRKYFEKEIERSKFLVNINLEIFLSYLQKFKNQEIELYEKNKANLFGFGNDSSHNIKDNSLIGDVNNSEDSSTDSIYQDNLSTKINKKTSLDNFTENFEKFERVIEILIKISPEDLFKEVKSLILNEYESTTNEIKSYLTKYKNEESKKLFTSFSQHILFILSGISFKLDYYTMAVNSLIEKLNRFFIEFVEGTADSKEFVRSLDLVQKFVKMKKNFMKDFCDTKMNIPDAQRNRIFSNVAFNRFCSFGRYFFNNLLSLIDMNIVVDFQNDLKIKEKNVFNIYKFKYKSGKRDFKWKNYNKLNFLSVEDNNLDKYFRLYFTTKSATWKYSTIQAGIKKQEICRICETNFEINEFVLHMFFCRELRVNDQQIIEIKSNMKKAVEDLKIYRESLLNEKYELKDIFFSPKSEFNQKFRLHMVDKTPKILNKKIEASQNQFFQFNNKLIQDAQNNKNKINTYSYSEVEFLDRIIQTISKEKDLSRDYYEKYPYKLSQLISIVHFTIYIFFQNKNSLTYSENLNKIFSNLFISLMKKLTIVENILSLKDSKEKARMKIKTLIYNNPTLIIAKEKELIKNSNNNIIENNENSDNNNSNNKINRLDLLKKNSSNYSNLSLKKESSGTINNSNNQQNLSNLNTTGSNHFSSKAILRKESVNDIKDIIDLTKSKLLTKRNLNTKLETPHKHYLLSLSNRNVCINQTKKQTLISPRENFVKAVSSELKNLTKISRNENSEKQYFHNNRENSNSSSNVINPDIQILNNNIGLIPEKKNEESFRNLFFNRSKNSGKLTEKELIESKKMLFGKNNNFSNKNIHNYLNNNSISLNNSGKTNNLSEQEFNNTTNFLSTSSICPVKNSMNAFRRSLFDKTASPFILNLNHNRLNSNSNLKSETDTDIQTIDNININDEAKISEIDMNEHAYSLIGEDSYSYLDSEMSFTKEAKRFLNREENIINQELDEEDSQFDEMIELMDDLQLSDPYREAELENSPRAEKNLLKITDFKFVMGLSSGGYGRVDLYKKISTGDLYAIKTVDIHKMRTKNISGLLKNETLIMNEIYSDFVVKCYYIFNDEKNYYYAMEYLPGGDLFGFLQQNNLSLETIKFIVAEVIFALRYLHSKNIIHKDIKPENIIISNEGHFKLTDFGISETGLQNNKNVISNIENFMDGFDDEYSIDPDKILGTENYMAPEVISDKEISFATDYWSLGVLIFDLFTELTPFYAENVSKIFENILNLNINWSAFDKVEIEYEDGIDIIKKFLVLDPNERWGDKHIEQIKNHKFFRGFDWDNLKQMKNLLVLRHVSERIKKLKQIKPSTIDVLNKIKENSKDLNEINMKINNGFNEKNNENKENVKNPINSLQNISITDDKFKQNFKLFCSERIDNLSKKNQDVLKTNLKTKKIDLYTEDQNFTDFMNDLD